VRTRLAQGDRLTDANVLVEHVVRLEIVHGELAENVDRLNFPPSDIEAIRRALEPIEKAAAKARQVAGKEVPESFGKDRHKRETSSRIGAFAGVSGRTVEKIAAVVAAAEAEPERFGKLQADMDRTGLVNGPFKRLKNIRQAEAIRAEPPPMPGKGPYRVIAADPPWPFELRDEDPSHRGVYPYPTMTLAQICAKGEEVRAIAHKDCILWLWTTCFHMREAFAVLDAWGFEHRTILTWVKPKFGYGDRLRNQTEHVIMAIRGKPTVQLTTESTVLVAPVGRRSEKPDAFYELVERLCPAPRYAELFSRRARLNWDGHGDEHPGEGALAAE
jgi:N6-adenosine-specific RNA methylase IME4